MKQTHYDPHNRVPSHPLSSTTVPSRSMHVSTPGNHVPRTSHQGHPVLVNSPEEAQRLVTTGSSAYMLSNTVGRKQGQPVHKGRRLLDSSQTEPRLLDVETKTEMNRETRNVKSKQRVKCRRVIEEVLEHVIIIPERNRRSESDYTEVSVMETIVEEVPTVYTKEIYALEKQAMYEDVYEIPETQVVERINYVPEVQYQDIIEEVIVPEYVYENESVEHVQRVPIEEFQFVPNYIKTKVPVDVEMQVPQVQKVRVERGRAELKSHDVPYLSPVPVEAVKEVEYSLPRLKEVRVQKHFDVWVPHFIEVPVSAKYASQQEIHHAEALRARVAGLVRGEGQFISLCDVENMAQEVNQTSYHQKYSLQDTSVRMKYELESSGPHSNRVLQQPAHRSSHQASMSSMAR